MGKKLFSPGEIVENSGIYPVVGPRGGDKGYEVTAVKGEPFPPLPEKGWGFGEPHLTKTAAEDSSQNSSQAMVTYSPPDLPDHRPIDEGNPTLVPSETLPSRRPILVGTRQVTSLDHLPQQRPIFENEIDIVAMHGSRPVVRLNSSLVPSASLPGNRPIAENSSPANENLMGYLD